VTASYAALRDQLELVSLKSRYASSLLFFLVGFLGIGWFYLGFRRMGLIHGLISVLSLTLSWFIDPASLFTIGLLLAMTQTVLSLYYLFNPDAKDARGELLK
jgi:TM2 domain-containing membrane protein YozV